MGADLAPNASHEKWRKTKCARKNEENTQDKRQDIMKNKIKFYIFNRNVKKNNKINEKII